MFKKEEVNISSIFYFFHVFVSSVQIIKRIYFNIFSIAVHSSLSFWLCVQVLCATLGLLSSQDLVDRITILTERENDGRKTPDTALSNDLPVGLPLQELNEHEVDEEANRYFERVYCQEVPVQTVVKMLQDFNQSPAGS